jgi:serine/threonine protein kinase
MSFDLPPRVLDLNDCVYLSEIGHGANRNIHSALDKSTGQVVAISQWHLFSDDSRQFVRSIATQWQLNLPGVVKIIGVSRASEEGEKVPFLVATEFMPHGNLVKLISERLKSNSPSTFRPTTFSKIIFGVAATMREIHSRGVLHRNPKPRNILLDENDEPHIDGFCVARFGFPPIEFSNGIGTPLFMAPEVLDGLGTCYDNRIDVYSYGVLIYHIFTDKLELADGRTMRQLFRAISAGTRFKWKPEIPEALWKLITSCWKQEPEKRPSFHEIAEMMLNSDDFTFPGTDLDEYHEYQTRIIRETDDSPTRDPSVILKFLTDIGLELECITGLASR